ncbi:MAG: glycosyltransferase family 2 protein [Lachnospiraceae bacterium]|nr:glycosyltransferase family 2 protein [Lachnospiraceae bacterium]
MNHTFVICAYKESPYLEECIVSLKQQTKKSEILVATSTPSAYIEELCSKYHLPCYVRDGKPGIGADWNYALSVAKTEYVTIAHQDDKYEAVFWERKEAYIEEAERLRQCPLIIFSDYREYIGQKADAYRTNLKIKRILLRPLIRKQAQNRCAPKRAVLRFGNAICCPSVTYNMGSIWRLLEQQGRHALFGTAMRSNLDWEAWEWLSRQKGAFVYIPELLMQHRIHEASETSAVIHEHQRKQEDYFMFCKFWPKWIAKILSGVYIASEKGNTVS